MLTELSEENRKYDDALFVLSLQPMVVTTNFRSKRLLYISWQNPPDISHWNSLYPLMGLTFLLSSLVILELAFHTGSGASKVTHVTNAESKLILWGAREFDCLLSCLSQEGCTSLHSLEQRIYQYCPALLCWRLLAGVI